MPIENEVKYVLLEARSIEAELTEYVNGDRHFPYGEIRCEFIDQAYLNNSTRIRRFTQEGRPSQMVFSFKQRVPNGMNVEVETELSRHDFDLLWAETEIRLLKKRFSFGTSVDGADLKWDIDFFVDRERETYIALAEVEMPEDMERPNRVPDFLFGRCTRIERSDDRFSSRKLADLDHARHMRKEMRIKL